MSTLSRYELEYLLLDLAMTHAQWVANLPPHRAEDEAYLRERAEADERAATKLLTDAGISAHDTEVAMVLYREISDRVRSLTDIVEDARERARSGGG